MLEHLIGENMKFVIVATHEETASRNIGNKIIEIGGFEKVNDKEYRKNDSLLVWKNEYLVKLQELDYPADCYIFVFCHKSEKNNPSLTVHVPGNLTEEVKSSGNPRELAIAHPAGMRKILQGLKKYAPEGYTVSYEATHHGPTHLSIPLMFVEIGSTEQHWNDPKAIEATAKAVMDLVNEGAEPADNCLGLGGNHYAERFTRRALDENMAFGHIIPAYQFSVLSQEVLKQAIQKTKGGIKYAVLDQRMQGNLTEREPILKTLAELGIELKKLK